MTILKSENLSGYKKIFSPIEFVDKLIDNILIKGKICTNINDGVNTTTLYAVCGGCGPSNNLEYKEKNKIHS